VTVLVPSNYASLSLRRSLAADSALANVRLSIPARLAELLGAPSLAAAGRAPLTPWVRLSAARAALAESPGVFAAVAGHPSTPRELVRTFRELRSVDPAGRERALDALARNGPRAADVVRLYRRFEQLCLGFFDEVDLVEAAANALVASASARTEIGDAILYLPREVTPALERLVRAAHPAD
jgi:hypothetical protein